MLAANFRCAVAVFFVRDLYAQPAQAWAHSYRRIFVFLSIDYPLEKFARGNVGVLQPTYARSYLVAAYRHLVGETLSDTEVKGLTGLWDDRLNRYWDESYEDWLKKWKDARAKVPGVAAPPDISVYRDREKPHEYESFLNCQADAFQNAVTTLDERTKTWGADSAAVRDWVAAQDMVFKNCRAGQEIPSQAAEQNALLRADRAYQIAAANFYATSLMMRLRRLTPLPMMVHRRGGRSRRTRSALTPAKGIGGRAGAWKPALADAEKRLQSLLRIEGLRSRITPRVVCSTSRACACVLRKPFATWRKRFRRKMRHGFQAECLGLHGAARQVDRRRRRRRGEKHVRASGRSKRRPNGLDCHVSRPVGRGDSACIRAMAKETESAMAGGSDCESRRSIGPSERPNQCCRTS